MKDSVWALWVPGKLLRARLQRAWASQATVFRWMPLEADPHIIEKGISALCENHEIWVTSLRVYQMNFNLPYVGDRCASDELLTALLHGYKWL